MTFACCHLLSTIPLAGSRFAARANSYRASEALAGSAFARHTSAVARNQAACTLSGNSWIAFIADFSAPAQSFAFVAREAGVTAMYTRAALADNRKSTRVDAQTVALTPSGATSYFSRRCAAFAAMANRCPLASGTRWFPETTTYNRRSTLAELSEG